MSETGTLALSPEEAREQYCYLITTGRVSGRPHEVEMWFAVHPDGADPATLYALSGGRDRSDWVKNVRVNPQLQIRIRETTYSARGAVVDGQAGAPRAREALSAKYYAWHGGALPNDWARDSLPVAFRLTGVVSS